MTVSRPLTGLERVWLVADGLWPPFVNQLVVEGAGGLDPTGLDPTGLDPARLDPARWRAAVDTVLPAWPGARARLRGALGWTRWVADGAPPAVVEVDGAGWDARGPAPFTARPLDPHAGPIVEVLLVSGATPRVILRTHHAAFDGRAAWALAEDLGAALRGEPVRGAAFADLSDLAYVGDVPPAPEPEADAMAPTGPATTHEEACTWARITVPSVTRGRVLPRALAAFASAAADFVEGPLRVSVPVDLRRHHPGLRAAANLTGFVRVDPRLPAGPALASALDARAEGGVVRTAHGLRTVPLWAMAAAGRRAARATLRTGRAATSATVSNLGRLDPRVLDGAGFRGERLYWIPPGNPGTPLFLALTGHPHGVELCGAMPVGFASGGRLTTLLERMAAELSVG
ncbi:MAG: hypothetical protein Q8P41_01155 [Pseudomonadota bacterium]|nr:hypothetical protein [Pseudomonadota bacterium]